MSGTTEYLDSHDGQPAPTGRGRTPWIVGGAVAVVALLGAGAWAAWSFFSTGPQPAEALPASTVAYASVDLDPSGGQKIEALRTLRKFPAFRDQVGLSTDDDVRKWVFEQVQDSGTCPDVDYGDDIEPWLGDRMAVAAVDRGEDSPVPVVVLQVSDQDAADEALATLRDCGGDLAWTIDGDWALLGETQEVVDGVAADATDEPLSEDADFEHWTDESGGDGIATVYVSPKAGELLADELGGLLPGDPLAAMPQEYGTCEAPCTGYSWTGPEDLPSEAADALDGFGGMAATLRFSDGSLELEVAGDAGSAQSALEGSEAGDDVLATLPDDTGVAIGVGFVEGWLTDLVGEDALRELAAQTGLDLPEDAETLAGRSAALAVSGDIDPDSLLDSPDGAGVPVGLKVEGDADAISSVLEDLGGPFGSDSEGDVVAIGPDPDYREALLADGGLGDTDVFQRAVPDAEDASAVLFVDFDAGSWLDSLAGDDQEVADNLAPLQGLGASLRTADGTTHLVLRVTTG